MRGQKLWTDDEREVIRATGPNFDALLKLLPGRTRIAIGNQCRKMGLIQKPNHVRSAADIPKLRKLYPAASTENICEFFPHSTWINIRQVARYHGFRRARRPFTPTGNPPIDQMLVKLFQANFSFPDLDKELRTKRYFQKHNWRRKANYNHMVKAIELLEGKLDVRWPEEP